MSDMSALLFAGVLLLGNAFFVGAEFALISARRTQIEPLAESGSRKAKATLKAMENVSLMMAGAQLGITVCSLALGSVGEPAVAHLLEGPFHSAGIPDALLHPISFVVAMSIVVFLHMVIGEMIPKNIAIAGPERAALLLGPPLAGIVTLLKPFVVGMNVIANAVLRSLGVQPKDEVASAYTRDEMAGLIDESHREGLLASGEHELVSGAFSLEDKTVASVLLDPHSLVFLSTGVSAEEVERRAVDTGYSRFPVASEDGSMLGYLHIKDVLETEPEKRRRPIATKWIRPFATMRSTDSLRVAIQAMQVKGAHMGQVIDADGSIAGVVALEDVLEELVGEIVDQPVSTS